MAAAPDVARPAVGSRERRAEDLRQLDGDRRAVWTWCTGCAPRGLRLVSGGVLPLLSLARYGDAAPQNRTISQSARPQPLILRRYPPIPASFHASGLTRRRPGATRATKLRPAFPVPDDRAHLDHQLESNRDTCIWLVPISSAISD